MSTYLWGKSGRWWHALVRHDPAYDEKDVESARLTQLARARDPDAPAVSYRQVVKTSPGTGRTLCGLTDLKLAKLGVDPVKSDPLCPACEGLASKPE
jgi:hypothetical protein